MNVNNKEWDNLVNTCKNQYSDLHKTIIGKNIKDLKNTKIYFVNSAMESDTSCTVAHKLLKNLLTFDTIRLYEDTSYGGMIATDHEGTIIEYTSINAWDNSRSRREREFEFKNLKYILTLSTLSRILFDNR